MAIFSRQVTTAHRGEAHHVEFLSRAVVVYDWEEEIITRIGTMQIGFKRFCAELESQFHARSEVKTAVLIRKRPQQSRETKIFR